LRLHEVDCSELVEAAYARAAMEIPDGSPYQFNFCRPVNEPEPGDLGFLWSDKWGRIGHVMIYVGGGMVIHAVGGRGVVEEPAAKYTASPRWRGWRRHPEFMRPREDRP